MSNKETTLKEKFKLALTSTAKVISDDLNLNNAPPHKKNKKIDVIEVGDIKNPGDLIKLRAETDSAALKKKF